MIPSSFEVVGHIAHLNLFPCHEKYKKIIGQVLLDKNPLIKTVVNKCEKLENVYRNPTLELLAGRPDFVADQKEGGCVFKVDF
jgi:tRNA (guanine37-N1)-methyltransferase